MYRNDFNARSPMRVFEGSMHGGLGRGNVGVVAAPPGLGKTAMLVQIALDDLLRDRKVLHVSLEHAVDHVRSYYAEIFHEISAQTHLDEAEAVKVEIERNRLIYSHLGPGRASAEVRSSDSVVSRLLETVDFARDVQHFEPDVIVLDGFDFSTASVASLEKLEQLARERSLELWMSAGCSFAPGASELPGALRPLHAHLAVVVTLEPGPEHVRLRLLKDHEHEGATTLSLRLDPHSMRVLDQDVRAPSERPRDPRRFKLHSGGARGAESEFGASAERWGLVERNYSFEGHRLRTRDRGVVMLAEEELRKGDFSLIYVSRRLGRALSDIPVVRSVLQTIWHQINAANQVFIVGAIQEDMTVRGGTGWGAELARLWKKPLYVYDQEKPGWFRWSGTAWEMTPPPVITTENFAGAGTQELNEGGKRAIRDLFLRSFGPPRA
jgi:hypothetical protein